MKPVNLVLITNHFPFGQGESFLEHEMPFLSSSFEKIIIISKNVSDKQTRAIQSNTVTERINPTSTVTESLINGTRLLLRPGFVMSLMRKEKQYLRQRNKKGSITTAFHFLFKAFQLSTFINQIIKKHNLSGNICFYSYWLDSSALAITMRQKGTTMLSVSRAHGGDLYEYRKDSNYIPFRELVAEKLALISPISLNGCDYLKSILHSRYHSKIKQSNLGTPHPAHIPTKKRDFNFKIVSCSNLIPLKRIHLIIEALATVSDLNIDWIHFGDGNLKQELVKHATNALPASGNIKFFFKGFVVNKELLEFYSTNYVDLFINTSIYEGVPVSMMEAQSYGIPIIGTNVGAVNEIIKPETGLLLGANPTPEEIGNAIRQILKKSDSEIETLRKNCRAHWEKNYNAAHNFSTFASDLKNLF